MIDNFFLYISFVIFACAAIFFAIYLIFLKERFAYVGVYALSVGLISTAIYLILRAFHIEHFPVTNIHEALLFFCLLLGIAFLIFFFKYRILIAGVFVSPLILFFSLISILVHTPAVPVLSLLQSFWLPIHVGSVFIGNALFALSFVISIVYMIENFRLKKKKFDNFGKQLPSLVTLDYINYLCLVYGFPFLTLGLITGAVWAQVAIGSYWNNDPKEIWSMITWMLYAALLHCRLINGWKGRRIAIFSIFAFIILVFSFVGVTYFFKGYHIFRGS